MFAAFPVVDPRHYTDRRELAAGGMGCIVTAYDTRLRRRVAIKELRGGEASLTHRFARETLLSARLEHPGIVSIHEGGQWPDGTPFYVMKLYGGVPLDRLIAQAPTLADRLALLPHVLAAADAVAYAHRHRIIHRDLKPGNVMVGEFGETVVIDWGLAKDLDAEELDPAGAPTPTRAGLGDHTHANELLGTPAYMAPEQAVSPLVDERADVYALGAILYHVLAGALPYQATSAYEFIAKLHAEAPIPLRGRVEVPGDLIAIVERAMAREPGARYASAGDLAADLRRFLAGQLVTTHQYSLRQLLRRWIRKHRLPLAIAAAATVALVAFGAIAVTRVFDEERRAQAARAKAEASETSADGLMQFMLDDLFQKLADTSQLGLLGPIAERAEDHLEAKVAAGIPVDALRRADAALATGEVRRAEGELDKALVSCRTSLALLEDVDLDAAAARTKQSIHRAHDCIGDVLLAKGDAPGAVAEYERALAVTQTTDDPHSARNHVTQLLSIASAIIEIDPPRAQPFAERARVEATRLDDSALIAEAHRWLGQSIVQQDLPAAVEHMKLAVERYRRLAVGASGVDSTALARRASTTFELGEFTKFVDPAAGAALNEEALQAFVELMGREPANEKYRDWHRNALAAQVRRRRRTWAWRDLLSDEVQVRAAFASARHDTNDTPMRWAYFEEAIGMSHLHQGNSGAAVAHFLAAIEHGQTALAANPNAAPARRLMTVARTGLGEAFSTRRQWAEAAAALTPVLDLAAQGAQLEAHALEWPEHQFNAGVELVQVHRHTRDAAARTDAVRQALAAAKTLLAMAPTWRPREMPTAADATTPDAVLAAIEQALAKR